MTVRKITVVLTTSFTPQLDRLIIGHDNQGSEPGWYLEEVDVDIPVRDEHYVFRCGGWIAGGDPGQRKEAVLFPGNIARQMRKREKYCSLLR